MSQGKPCSGGTGILVRGVRQETCHQAHRLFQRDPGGTKGWQQRTELGRRVERGSPPLEGQSRVLWRMARTGELTQTARPVEMWREHFWQGSRYKGAGAGGGQGAGDIGTAPRTRPQVWTSFQFLGEAPGGGAV